MLKDLPVIMHPHGVCLVINTNNLVSHCEGDVKKEFVTLTEADLTEMSRKHEEVERKLFAEAQNKISVVSNSASNFSPGLSSTPMHQIQRPEELNELFEGLDEESIFGDF